jgi:hypothetical protein
MAATMESLITVPEDVLFRELGGESVILNLESAKYYGLDEVGTRMWVLLAEHGRVSDAYRALLEEYEVAEAELERDLLQLINDLVGHGLLRLDAA